MASSLFLSFECIFNIVQFKYVRIYGFCYLNLLNSFLQWIFIDHMLCASHCSRCYERQQWTNNTSLFSWRSHLSEERQWKNKICQVRISAGKMIKAGERDRECGGKGVLLCRAIREHRAKTWAHRRVNHTNSKSQVQRLRSKNMFYTSMNSKKMWLE